MKVFAMAFFFTMNNLPLIIIDSSLYLFILEYYLLISDDYENLFEKNIKIWYYFFRKIIVLAKFAKASDAKP